MSFFFGTVSEKSLGDEEIRFIDRTISSSKLISGKTLTCLSEDKNFSLGIQYHPEREAELETAFSDKKGEGCSFFEGFLANAGEINSALKQKDPSFHQGNTHGTVLSLYQEEDEKSFEKLNGEFALVLYDRSKKHLYLVRDRTGSRPLYYCIDNDSLFFSNRMEILLRCKAVSRDLNEEGLYHFFTYGAVPPPHTLVRGIQKVAAGSFLSVNLRSGISPGLLQKHYWLPLSETSVQNDENDCSERIRTLLTQAVQRRIGDRKTLSLPLAGMDSTALLALARKQGDENIKTYTSFVDSPLKDEMRDTELATARETAGSFQTEHQEIFIPEKELLNLLPETIKTSPEICAYYALPEIYYLTRAMIRDNADTVLFGTLADAIFLDTPSLFELCSMLEGFFGRHILSSRAGAFFSGLIHSSINSVRRENRAQAWRAKALELLSQGHTPYLGHKFYLTDTQKKSLFSRSFLKRNSGLSTAALVDGCVKKLLDKRADITPVEKFVGVNLMLVNPETVIIHLYHSLAPYAVQPRFPYVDSDLLDFVLGIPLHVRMKNKIPKYILKKALQGTVPEKVIQMKKVKLGRGGYGLFKRNLTEKLEEILKISPVISEKDYFSFDSVKELLYIHKKGKKSLEVFLYPLLVFLYWHREWIEGKE